MKHLDEGTLQAWLDGSRSDLSAEERAEIERHLAGCGTCAGRLEELEETSHRVETLFASAPEAPPEAIPAYRTVEERARRHRASGDGWRRWRTAAWAASVAAALGVGWMAGGLYRAGGTAATSDDDIMAGAATPSAEAPIEDLVARDDSSAPAAPEANVAEEPAVDEPAVVAAEAPSSAESAASVLERAEPEEEAGETAMTVADPAPARMRMADARTRIDAPAVIRGRVTNELGRPLESAQIFVPSLNAGGLTNEQGMFVVTLPDLAGDTVPRELTLVAELIGHASASRPLSVRGGDEISTDFRLGTTALTLQELVVTGVPEGAVPVDSAAGGGGRERPAADSVQAEAPAAEARAAEARREPADLGPHRFLPEIVTPLVWRAVSRAEAEAAVGFTLRSVSGLPIVRYETGSTGAITWVRVLQELEGGGRLELIQGPASLDPAAAPPTGERGRVMVRRGDAWILALAPLSVEALEALLARLR